MTADRLQML